MVIHDNVLYKCTTACSAGTWQTNQGYFTATTLTSEVTNVNASLNGNYNESSAPTNISGTRANPYIVPSDGYIFMSVATGTSINIKMVYGSNSNNDTVIGAVTSGLTATFVRKGMKIYQTVTGTGSVLLTFTPLASY